MKDGHLSPHVEEGQTDSAWGSTQCSSEHNSPARNVGAGMSEALREGYTGPKIIGPSTGGDDRRESPSQHLENCTQGPANAIGSDRGRRAGKRARNIGYKGTNSKSKKVDYFSGHRHDPKVDGTRSHDGASNREGSTNFVREKCVRNKYAILFGYNGSKFHGMQKQNGPGQENVRTVESELEKALHSAGGLRDAHVGDFYASHWSRSGRTDRGVHAACQIVAVKLALKCAEGGQLAECDPQTNTEASKIRNPNSESTVPPNKVAESSISNPEDSASIGRKAESMFLVKLKETIPRDITVYGMVPVTKSFDARRYCCTRKYLYYFPTNLLLTETHVSRWRPRSKPILEGDDTPLPLIPVERSMSQAELERVEDILKEYVGTHRFHNFTSSVSNDASNSFLRTIESIKVKVEQICGNEMLRVELEGRSYMLNQIRKMIALAIEVFRGTATKTDLRKCFEGVKRYLHMAPAEGLLLYHPVYTVYNNGSAISAGRPLLDPDVYSERIEGFIRDYLLPDIGEANRGGIFTEWLEQVDRHPFHQENLVDIEGVQVEEGSEKQVTETPSV